MDYKMKEEKMVKMDRPSDKDMSMGMGGDMGHASKVYKIDTEKCIRKYDQPYVK